MFDELQEFAIAYDQSALIQRLLGKAVLAPLVFLALFIGFGWSYMDDPAPGWATHIPFAVIVALTLVYLAYVCADLWLLVAKRPALSVRPDGIRFQRAFFGTTQIPWSQISRFAFRSVTNPITNSSRVYLDVLANPANEKRLLTIHVDDLAITGPETLAHIEKFAAQHRRNHPERFAPKNSQALPVR